MKRWKIELHSFSVDAWDENEAKERAYEYLAMRPQLEIKSVGLDPFCRVEDPKFTICDER